MSLTPNLKNATVVDELAKEVAEMEKKKLKKDKAKKKEAKKKLYLYVDSADLFECTLLPYLIANPTAAW